MAGSVVVGQSRLTRLRCWTGGVADVQDVRGHTTAYRPVGVGFTQQPHAFADLAPPHVKELQRLVVVREGVDGDDLALGVRTGSGYSEEPSFVEVEDVDRGLGRDPPAAVVAVEESRNPSLARAAAWYILPFAGVFAGLSGGRGWGTVARRECFTSCRAGVRRCSVPARGRAVGAGVVCFLC
jgi:hypothetical protein